MDDLEKNNYADYWFETFDPIPEDVPIEIKPYKITEKRIDIPIFENLTEERLEVAEPTVQLDA